MRKVKILHCSDIHFDTAFKELNKEISNNSREELLEVLKKIVDLSIKENVQVLLIAGDVFDNFTVSKTTLIFIINQLNRIKDKFVFISPGNHDPYNDKSFYNLISWPDHVHIFKGMISKKEISELGVVVYGAGFKNKYERESLVSIKDIDSSKINLMVLHGDIASRESKNDYNPIYIEDIRKSNMDYIALGHVHKFSGVLKEGNSYYAYSGCPQGRGFDEDGEKGVLLGEVYRGGVNLEFIPSSERQYIVQKLDISDCNTYEDVKEKLIKLFNKENRLKNLFKVILTGRLKSHFSLDVRTLEEKIKNHYYFIKVINKTTVDIDLADVENDYSVKGQFIKLMLEKLKEVNEDEKEIVKKALEIGIRCLSEEEVNYNDN